MPFWIVQDWDTRLDERTASSIGAFTTEYKAVAYAEANNKLLGTGHKMIIRKVRTLSKYGPFRTGDAK